jgi:DNA adenine methylase
MDSPIKRHGGKHYLAKWIIAHFPEWEKYTHYVEPFFGSGAVLFAHRQGKSEVANDIDGNLIAFFQCLSDPLYRADLIDALSVTPMHEAIWEAAVERLERQDAGDQELSVLDKASAFFIECRQSYQALGSSFTAISRTRTRGGRNEQVNAWFGAIDSLAEIAGRLLNVLFTSRPALELIMNEDGPGTLFYLDPPYLHSTRTAKQAYKYEMSEEEHSEMIDLLSISKSKIILSGYDNPLYSRKLKHWQRYDREIDNKASNVRRMVTESVWCNY